MRIIRPFRKFRRKFPDRTEARRDLSWMPVGKTIKIYYSKFRYEFVTMTTEGLKFHGYTPIGW
jgi:hypothetical protein